MVISDSYLLVYEWSVRLVYDTSEDGVRIIQTQYILLLHQFIVRPGKFVRHPKSIELAIKYAGSVIYVQFTAEKRTEVLQRGFEERPDLREKSLCLSLGEPLLAVRGLCPESVRGHRNRIRILQSGECIELFHKVIGAFIRVDSSRYDDIQSPVRPRLGFTS